LAETLGSVRTTVTAMCGAARDAEAELEPAQLAAIQTDGRRAIFALRQLLERLRTEPDRPALAGDLPDRCGSAIGVMTVQAGAAQAIGGHDRERARASVRAVQAAGTEALGLLASLSRLLDD
jgi:hypothetical protein